MASPPPGGPQTPQPPYPQQPYPQQPYPPQYPPQQPYYPQPVPPPKQSNTVLIIVLVVVVVIVVLAVAAWYAFTIMFSPIRTTTQNQVTGVSFTILYPGSTQYFGRSPLTTCSACPISVTITTPFQYVLSLTNSDSASHNVTDVSLSAFLYQYTLVSAVPNPTSSNPLVIGPGGTGSIALTVQYTGLSGSNVLTGTVTTT